MEILTYLYDTNNEDKEIELNKNVVENLTDRQLLWVNILKRDEELVR